MCRSVREASSRSEEARLTAETDAREAQRRLATAKQAFARTLQDKEEAAQRVRGRAQMWRGRLVEA